MPSARTWWWRCAPPLDTQVLRALGFAAERKIVPVLASTAEIEAALKSDPGSSIAVWEHAGSGEGVAIVAGALQFDQGESQAAEALTQRLETESLLTPSGFDAGDEGVKDTDSTLVRLVNKIILEAQQMTASDIHIDCQPGEKDARVRFRIDGVLQDHLQVPIRFRKALVSRIKVMASLDISERRKPQDGKIDFRRFGPAAIELRVATIPTHSGGENVVMRILSSSRALPMEKIDFSAQTLRRMRELVEKPYGLLLVCGPTGSGKTSTLHSLIGHINTPDRKIWTAEDPVEITQPGLAQVQVNAKIGWTFAAALRAFLRADPDVIMVGEMRDEETAHVGVEASLTGHLVLSTLHTNSAAEAITRLLDMGLDPFNFSDALVGVLAQRLVRRLCDSCRVAEETDADGLRALADEYCADSALNPLDVLANWKEEQSDGLIGRMRAVGCESCRNTGYKGRMAVHELLVGTPEIRRLVRTRASLSEIVACAISEGMLKLRQDGIRKVLQGHTTMEQVRAACA